jgi:flagellar L-ring protein FlgH
VSEVDMDKQLLCAALFAVLVFSGCAGTDYTSRIKDVPFEIDQAYRKPPTETAVKVKYPNGGIWPGERYANTYFSDQRAMRVGDIITIKIVESSKASEKASTGTGRNSELAAGAPNLLGLEKYYAKAGITGDSMISATSKNSFDGTGETSREGSIATTMSAKVVEVMPNGNLAIEGKRQVTVNNERREVLLQGLVRPRDIAADNSVNSTMVADARIILTGIGVVGEKQNPGWLTRIFDVVWPF